MIFHSRFMIFSMIFFTSALPAGAGAATGSAAQSPAVTLTSKDIDRRKITRGMTTLCQAFRAM